MQKGKKTVMLKLLKRFFKLLYKMRWLKIIDKECDKYFKLRNKLFQQQFIVNSLEQRYKEIFGEDIRTASKKGGAE